jgi:phosphatidylinositol alpha-1,6-mannosyltransferase
MRLLALVTDAFGGSGGIARYNQNLMLALAQSAHVSEIVVLPRFAEAVPDLPAKVRQLGPSAGRIAWSARGLALAAQRGVDAVFCGHLNAAPLAAAIAGLRRAPLWVQVHGVDAWERRGVAHRRALRSAALVTSVSRYTRSRLLEWAELPPHRVRVLPNTVTPGYPPRRPRRNDLMARLGLTGRRVILTVGRLSASERYKGHDRLIAALPEIVARVHDAAYLIVGSGDDQPRLERLAQAAGVDDRVVFAGRVAEPELPDYFALADVFAMPSTGEGFGIVFIEAAASGVPVIGGNCDGSVDALADGRIGRLVDPHAPAEIEDAVIDALLGRHPVPADSEEMRRFAFARFAAHVDALVGALVPRSHLPRRSGSATARS